MSEEDEIGMGSGESTEELEAPALKSSLKEHRIVDVQKPVPGPSKLGESQEEPDTPPSGVKKDDRTLAVAGRAKETGRRRIQ